MKKYVNGKLEDMTPAEIKQRQEDDKVHEIEISEMKAEKENKDNLKTSAKAKLMAGEKLTKEEADILVGV